LWEEGGTQRVAERHIPYAAPVQQQDMQRALHRLGCHQGEVWLPLQVLLLLHQGMRLNVPAQLQSLLALYEFIHQLLN
ncbi:hypothetical protein BAE44_0011465, partial [Dichanthelium oligosanthes]